MVIEGPSSTRAGGKVSLRCVAKNANPPPDIKWTVNGRVATGSEAEKERYKNDQITVDFLKMFVITIRHYYSSRFIIQDREYGPLNSNCDINAGNESCSKT